MVEGQRAEVVRDWMERVVTAQGHIDPGRLVIHADRGSAMTSKPVSELLADLHIGRTHSRAHVCLLTGYSEAAFKTIKYAPVFPGRFGSIEHARQFAGGFLDLSRYAGDAPTIGASRRIVESSHAESPRGCARAGVRLVGGYLHDGARCWQR